MLAFATEAVQRSVMFLHLKTLSDRDLAVVRHEVNDLQTKFILDIPQKFDRLLKIKSVEECIESSPMHTLSMDAGNVYSVIGQELYIEFAKSRKAFDVVYYKAPKIHPLASTDSWIYKEYPYLVASHAVRAVGRKINSHITIPKGESEAIFGEEYADMIHKEKAKGYGTN